LLTYHIYSKARRGFFLKFGI